MAEDNDLRQKAFDRISKELDELDQALAYARAEILYARGYATKYPHAQQAYKHLLTQVTEHTRLLAILGLGENSSKTAWDMIMHEAELDDDAQEGGM